MSSVFLSVIIPSYNEMTNLRKGVLDKVKSFMDKKKYEYEVIIVDDGSRDGSVEFVKKFAKENKRFFILENKHLGKAGAVTSGMLAAKGEYIVFTDMDQATPIEEVDRLLPIVSDKHFDIAIGSRSLGGERYPISRKILHEGMIFLRKILVGLPNLKDTQCGFKMFNKKAAQDLFSRLQTLHHGFSSISGSAVTAGFDVELLVMAEQKGYKIKEMPVEWLYVETRRVNPIKDSIRAIEYMIKIRLNKMQGIYK